jgi:hypothetical protein
MNINKNNTYSDFLGIKRTQPGSSIHVSAS